MSGPAFEVALCSALRARGSQHAQALRDVDSLRDVLSGHVITTLMDAPWAPIYLAVCFLLHPLIGVVALAGAVAILLIAVLNERATKDPLVRAALLNLRALDRLGSCLRNAEAVWSRAEAWRDGLGAMDAVTARALAALPVLCEYAAPLLRPGGVLVCWKGAVEAAEEADGRAAAELLGLSAPDVRAVVPYPGSRRRTLWVFRRVGDLPAGFPRRAGMALKRPLRAG